MQHSQAETPTASIPHTLLLGCCSLYWPPNPDKEYWHQIQTGVAPDARLTPLTKTN